MVDPGTPTVARIVNAPSPDTPHQPGAPASRAMRSASVQIPGPVRGGAAQ